MSNPIYLPASAPEDWRLLLADPALHWKQGRSAHALAYTWHHSEGLPGSVGRAFGAAGRGALEDLKIVAAFPEYEVALPGGARASQTDLLVLAGGEAGGLVVLAVEGKVTESFGPTVAEWAREPTPGKTKRLDTLRATLGLENADLDGVRYQLLHRTASALIAASRFGAATAVMLVHSFNPDGAGFTDYRGFAELLGVRPERGAVVRVGELHGRELYLGWVEDPPPPAGAPTWINTHSGGRLDYATPRVGQIDIEDIAAGLSKVCRFGAQALHFFSVAQHAVMLHDRIRRLGRDDLALAALHHDSHEAYTCDLPTPLKRLLQPGYGVIANGLDNTIAKALGIKPPKPDSPDGQLIKQLDDQQLLWEAHYLLPDRGAAIAESRGLDPYVDASKPQFDPWLPDDAQRKFRAAHDASL
jgi:hypothetical protein